MSLHGSSSKYRPLRTLGAGGMAKVTLAVDDESGSYVVLKRTLSGSAQDERRLRVEGNLGRRLKHPSIVRTLDTFDDDEGRAVVVLEYVPGLSMSALRGAGPLPPEVCAVIGMHVAEALHAIHTAVDEVGKPLHMLHRDVTPANVLVDLQGRAKLIDLGIARAADANLTLTATGEVRGTLRYLAPELFQGEKQSTSTDLWALGIVILEAALGEPLHNGSTAEIIARILKHAPLTDKILARVHPALAEVLATVLVADPAAREKDASVVARAFARMATRTNTTEEALAAHVTRVVESSDAADKGSQQQSASHTPDDESWSTLLDARANLAATRAERVRPDAATGTPRTGFSPEGARLDMEQRRVLRRRRSLIAAAVGGAAAIALAGVAAMIVFAPSTTSTTSTPSSPSTPSTTTTTIALKEVAPTANAPSLNPDRLVPSPTGPARPSVVLLPYGSTWRYHDKGTDPGKAWRMRDFNDRAWAEGRAKLGYGGDGEVTVLSYGDNEKRKHAAAYFRTRFDVDARTAEAARRDGAMIVANMIYDDGAALYLNGVEILRTGLAANATHKDYALQVIQRGRGELKGQVFRLPANALRAGDNVLAAEVHQADPTSSDLAFELELALEKPASEQ